MIPTHCIHIMDEVEGFLAAGDIPSATKRFLEVRPKAPGSFPEWFELLARITMAMGNLDKGIALLLDGFERFPISALLADRIATTLAYEGHGAKAFGFLKHNHPQGVKDWEANLLIATSMASSFPEKAELWLTAAQLKAPDQKLLQSLVDERPQLAAVQKRISGGCSSDADTTP